MKTAILNFLLILLFLTIVDGHCSNFEDSITGTHPLTLQWLDNFNRGNTGKIRIFRKEGQLFAEGTQEEEYEGERNWMNLYGLITVINPREIELDGVITTRVSFINNGKAHERKGVFCFKAWGKRPYWRMQNNRLQPDNGFEVTDYIDIHLKKLGDSISNSKD